MRGYDILIAMLIVNAAYFLGDRLAARGIERDSSVLHRLGCLLVAIAFAGLTALFVVMCAPALWEVRPK